MPQLGQRLGLRTVQRRSGARRHGLRPSRCHPCAPQEEGGHQCRVSACRPAACPHSRTSWHCLPSPRRRRPRPTCAHCRCRSCHPTTSPRVVLQARGRGQGSGAACGLPSACARGALAPWAQGGACAARDGNKLAGGVAMAWRGDGRACGRVARWQHPSAYSLAPPAAWQACSVLSRGGAATPPAAAGSAHHPSLPIPAWAPRHAGLHPLSVAGCQVRSG